jgi:hypothetical protein
VLITVFLLLPIGWCWLRRHRASRRRTNAVLAKLGYIHRSASPRGAAPYDGVSALASNKRYIHMESELEPLSPVPDSHIRDAFACGNSVVTDVMHQSEREQRKVAEDLEQQQRQPAQGGRQYGQQQQQQHWKNNSSGFNGSSARRSSGVLARNAPHLMSRDMSTIASSAAGGSTSNSSGTTTTTVSSGGRHNMPVAQPVVVVHTAVTSSSGNGNNRNGQHHRRHQHAASTSTNSVHSFNSVDLSDSGSVQHQQRHHHGDIPVAQAVLAPTDSSSAGMTAAQRAVMLRQNARGARTSLMHATNGHNSARLLDINGAPIEYNPWQRDSSSNSIISTTSSVGGARDSGQGWERVWLSQSGNSNSSSSHNNMQR